MKTYFIQIFFSIFLLTQCQDIQNNQDQQDCLDSIATESLSKGVIVAGPWNPPADVLRVGDTQDVPYHGAPRIADGGYCESDNPWACSCHHPDCSSGLPGTLAFARYLRMAFPQISSAGGFQCCRQNTSNTANLSVHSIGRAIDLMIPRINGDADNTAGDEVANWLIVNAESIGVQYIAWDRMAWSAHKSPGSKFNPFNGPIPHTDHIHVELSLDGANERTPFFRNGLINEPARQCEPRCDGTRIIDANCNAGDCAAYGNTCIADPTPRCGVAECPRMGSGKVCGNESLIIDCRDGALVGAGECGQFAAYCSTAGRDSLDATCVSAFCVSGPSELPYDQLKCSFINGKQIHCKNDGSFDLIDCPTGQICSMMNGQVACEAPRSECQNSNDPNQVNIQNVCIDDHIARCENGNIVRVEACEGNNRCQMINGQPICVSAVCLNGNTIKSGHQFCLDNGMIGECNAMGDVMPLMDCLANERCVQNGDEVYCVAVASVPEMNDMGNNSQSNEDFGQMSQANDMRMNLEMNDLDMKREFADQMYKEYPKPKIDSCGQSYSKFDLYLILFIFALIYQRKSYFILI
jgi:hypothetical protein